MGRSYTETIVLGTIRFRYLIGKEQSKWILNQQICGFHRLHPGIFFFYIYSIVFNADQRSIIKAFFRLS